MRFHATHYYTLFAHSFPQDPADQEAIDKVMLDLDGTENKTNLGANAILGAKSHWMCDHTQRTRSLFLWTRASFSERNLARSGPLQRGVSMACCRAGAAQKGISLYRRSWSLSQRIWTFLAKLFQPNILIRFSCKNPSFFWIVFPCFFFSPIYGSFCDGCLRHINELAGKPPMSMPVPCFNVINGGVHAGNFLAFQATTFQRSPLVKIRCNYFSCIRCSKITYAMQLKSLEAPGVLPDSCWSNIFRRSHEARLRDLSQPQEHHQEEIWKLGSLVSASELSQICHLSCLS